jgi:hypothetical protein
MLNRIDPLPAPPREETTARKKAIRTMGPGPAKLMLYACRRIVRSRDSNKGAADFRLRPVRIVQSLTV